MKEHTITITFYDHINHKRVLTKVYKTTNPYHFLYTLLRKDSLNYLWSNYYDGRLYRFGTSNSDVTIGDVVKACFGSDRVYLFNKKEQLCWKIIGFKNERQDKKFFERCSEYENRHGNIHYTVNHNFKDKYLPLPF